MPTIPNIPATWTAGEALTKRTLFQCRTGQVRVDTGAAAPGADDGAVMAVGDAIELEAGVTVYWMRHTQSVAAVARVELEP